MVAIKAPPSFPSPLPQPQREAYILKNQTKEGGIRSSELHFCRKTCKTLLYCKGSVKCNREMAKCMKTHPTGFKSTVIPCTIDN